MEPSSRPSFSFRSRMGSLLLLSVLIGAAVAGLAQSPAIAAEALPPDEPGRGVVYRGMRERDLNGPCGRVRKLEVPGPAACTHGPDPAPPGIDVRVERSVESVALDAAAAAVSLDAAGAAVSQPSTAEAAGSVACYGDGQSGNRVQLIYARASNVADRFTQLAPSLQQVAAQVDSVVNVSASETGGIRRVRYVTDAGCKPVVSNVVLSSTGDDSFSNTILELRAQGYSRVDRKYLVWVDANVYCGIAQIYDDDRASAENYSNGNPLIPGEVARVDNGCWALEGQSVEAHELMHTLGGVQATAPNATPYGHCTDDYDRMCYADGSGAPMRVVCPSTSGENGFDCNHDDYFSTAPAPGSYLATHWNTANSVFLSSSPTASAWGYNGVGSLGNGTVTDSAVPVPTSILPILTAVSAGAYHNLALRSDGTVWAWGWNSFGQLGDGTTLNRLVPVQVKGLSGIVAIAAGSIHSVALRSDGTVWAWGWNGVGQLGDGTSVDRHLPVRVAGLTGVTRVAVGLYHSLALRGDGAVRAWGWNAFGQVGNGTVVSTVLPVAVNGLSGVIGIAGGAGHSLAVRLDGSVWSWGLNAFGQLGDGSKIDRRTAAAVPALTGMATVSAGFYHSVAVTRTGSVKAWGWNGVGQLGDNTVTDRHSPVTVSGLSGAIGISAGFFHNVALAGDGSVSAWGSNAYGQLGDASLADRRVPVEVSGASARSVSAGGSHSVMS